MKTAKPEMSVCGNAYNYREKSFPPKDFITKIYKTDPIYHNIKYFLQNSQPEMSVCGNAYIYAFRL
jgi:hypothetical protein